MTQDLIGRWFARNTFYRIERKQEVDNADQRIADDARLFIEGSFDLGLQMMNQTGSIFIFGFMLWNLAPPLEVGGYLIHGYLFWTAVLYGFFQVGIVHLVGRKLSTLNFERQRREPVDARYRPARAYGSSATRQTACNLASHPGRPPVPTSPVPLRIAAARSAAPDPALI